MVGIARSVADGTEKWQMDGRWMVGKVKKPSQVVGEDGRQMVERVGIS